MYQSAPKYLGEIPVRTELTVLPADPPSKSIGWMCYEVSGGEIHPLPEGTVPPFTPEQFEELTAAENIATGDLQPGRRFLVPTLVGWVVATYGEDGYLHTDGGNVCNVFLSTEEIRQPPRWVSSSFFNVRALQRLKLNP